MKRLLPIAAAASLSMLCTGCFFFHRKSHQPKQSSAIATQDEKEFETRWVAKRSGELVNQGQTPEAARQQAVSEFSKRYQFDYLSGK